MSSFHREFHKREDGEESHVFGNANRGWTFTSLCQALGYDREAVKRQMKKRGLALRSRPGHTLTSEDVETVAALVAARRAERLYGTTLDR